MSDPLVSVIIPSYNHASYIQQAVESVLKQTWYHLELIIIDDGSTDNSCDYLQTICDPRATVLRQTNCGAHATINRGLEMAKGEFLAVLNSDDMFFPKRIESCVGVLLADSDVDLVSTWLEIIDEKGHPTGIKEGWRNNVPWPIPTMGESFAGTDDYSLNLLMANFVATTSNIVMRRRVYETIGGMHNLRFAHDWDFLLRAGLNFKCHQLEQTLVKYRVHAGNTLKTNRNAMLLEVMLIWAYYLPQYCRQKLFTIDVLSDMKRIINSFNFQGAENIFLALSLYFQTATNTSAEEAYLKLLDQQDWLQQLSVFVPESPQPQFSASDFSSETPLPSILKTAGTMLDLGRTELAHALLDQALELATSSRIPAILIQALLEISCVFEQAGYFEEAHQYINQAYKLTSGHELVTWQNLVLERIKSSDPLRYYQRYKDIYQPSLVESMKLFEQGDRNKATQLWNKTVEMAEQETPPVAVEIFLESSSMMTKLGNEPFARQMLQDATKMATQTQLPSIIKRTRRFSG